MLDHLDSSGPKDDPKNISHYLPFYKDNVVSYFVTYDVLTLCQMSPKQ